MAKGGKPTGKTVFKYIEDNNKRQSTFTKRRYNVMKKAEELSLMCGCEIAVIIFSNTNKKYEYIRSTRTMEAFLTRYRTYVAGPARRARNGSNQLLLVENDPDVDVATLREELIRLRGSYNQLLGKNLEGLNDNELQELEQKLVEGYNAVRNKKELLYMEEMQAAKFHVEELRRENDALREELEELKQMVMMKSATGRGGCGGGSSYECGESSKRKCTEMDAGEINFAAGLLTDDHMTVNDFQYKDILRIE